MRLTNKISSACYALRSLREEATTLQMKMLYHALVESHLRYSIKLWGNSYAYNIKKAFVIQKRAIRTIFRLPQEESCKEYFVKLGVLTAPSLYILTLLCDLLKHSEKMETSVETEIRLTTRRKDVPVKGDRISSKLLVFSHSARCQAIWCFNRLPLELKSISRLPLFKRKLKELLIKECFYSMEEFIQFKSENTLST